jgi:alpha-tubulin suppressor-like RCC1 family protein
MQVYACGYNAYGQAGRLPVQRPGADDAFEPSLANIPFDGGIGAESVELLVCGADHAIVLLSNATMYGFGLNSFGQLMDETNSGLSNPNPQFISIDPDGEEPLRCNFRSHFRCHSVGWWFQFFAPLSFPIPSLISYSWGQPVPY